MKDHPIEDVKEKLTDVQHLMESDLVSNLDQSLKQRQWEQNSLNELFHALKKLEKNLSDEEQKEAIQGIGDFVNDLS